MISIRKYRGKAGISQQDFAKQIGVSRQYLSSLEQENVVAPVNIVKKVAEVCGVSPIVIYGMDNFYIAPETVEDKQFLIDLLQKSINED